MHVTSFADAFHGLLRPLEGDALALVGVGVLALLDLGHEVTEFLFRIRVLEKVKNVADHFGTVCHMSTYFWFWFFGGVVLLVVIVECTAQVD